MANYLLTATLLGAIFLVSEMEELNLSKPFVYEGILPCKIRSQKYIGKRLTKQYCFSVSDCPSGMTCPEDWTNTNHTITFEEKPSKKGDARNFKTLAFCEFIVREPCSHNYESIAMEMNEKDDEPPKIVNHCTCSAITYPLMLKAEQWLDQEGSEKRSFFVCRGNSAFAKDVKICHYTESCMYEERNEQSKWVKTCNCMEGKCIRRFSADIVNETMYYYYCG